MVTTKNRHHFATLTLSICALVFTGCGKKADSSKTQGEPNSTDKKGNPAESKDTKGKEKPKASLPTKNELEEQLKGKTYEQVKAILGKPTREAGTDSDAGRLIYDTAIANDTELGTGVGGTLWFAKGIMDHIQFHKYASPK
jgi:hypothetical protein